ncbi:MAG: hypothetical protein AAFQ27_10655 [Pseudomonadota bacterium]
METLERIKSSGTFKVLAFIGLVTGGAAAFIASTTQIWDAVESKTTESLVIVGQPFQTAEKVAVVTGGCETQAQGYVIEITAINNSDLPVKIDGLIVRIDDVKQLGDLEGYFVESYGVGPKREFLACIEEQPGEYRAGFINQGEFVSLDPGELEVLRVMISTNQKGKRFSGALVLRTIEEGKVVVRDAFKFDEVAIMAK